MHKKSVHHFSYDAQWTIVWAYVDQGKLGKKNVKNYYMYILSKLHSKPWQYQEPETEAATWNWAII